MSSKKIAVWSDVDLDGAMCQMIYTWMHNETNIEKYTCNAARLREELLKWLNTHKFSDYKQVVFADLDTSSIADLIDLSNVIIYDHHESHKTQAASYIKAKIHVYDCKSTAEIIFKENKNILISQKAITPERAKLLLLVSDYDSYTLQLKESKNLSIIFWSYTGNRVEQFCKEFVNGFNGFTQLQQNAIVFYYKKLKEITDDLHLFTGTIKENKVISCFCSTAHNDVAHYIINTHKASIAILVNPKTQTVSFRKSKDCKVNLSVLADTLCGEGAGGHDSAAGGKITEKFLLFTKTLSPHES